MSTIYTRVRVVLDIKTSGNWQDNCKLDQIKKQSMDKAQLTLSKILYNNRKEVVIVKKPQFASIRTELE